MKIAVLFAVAALGSTVPVLVNSQPVSQAIAAPTASPEKVELAKRLVLASGGADQLNALMGTVFQSMNAEIDRNLPAEQKRFQSILMQKMQARFAEMTPKMLDIVVKVYSENLTDDELRAEVAWMESEPAQALRKKTPAILRETMQLMMPMIAQISIEMKSDVVDEICKETKCSLDDRQHIESAMAKALPKQTS